jgi:hypothetical protein
LCFVGPDLVVIAKALAQMNWEVFAFSMLGAIVIVGVTKAVIVIVDTQREKGRQEGYSEGWHRAVEELTEEFNVKQRKEVK